MLKQGIKIVVLCIILFLSSCKDKVLNKEEQKQFDLKRMQIANKKRALYFNFSKTLVGEKEYYEVYNNARDTVVNWTTNKLKYTGQFANSLILDSLVCFNAKKDRCYMALGSSYGTDAGDNIQDFYGVKIKGKWYFFQGSTTYLPRDYYQDDMHIPLSLDLMKQIAIEEIFSGYLIEIPSSTNSSKVQYKINDSKFISMEPLNNDGTFGSCYNCKTFDEYVIYMVNKNWKNKMDSGDVAPAPSTH
ncbi:hypothetical protein SAMN05444396_103350 [Flavobacterium segetis]|uniref:Lipoprotein n=1 Tax=Flavobacterium segetis TaxID=271157 RepID=A0A1M5G8Q8_9FLAO|nr:hypothetical protein [Flavobacterium segetis]SHG00074.1 hypothetical protein SAMN05444396_103350 [Flavobacterium segetis]